MHKHQISHFETKTRELSIVLTRLGADEDFEKLFKIIHSPGFTTVAEGIFLIGIVEAMHEQARVLVSMKSLLLSGASKVELNPQPLPP